MANAPRDNNRIPSLLAASSVDGTTPVTLYADPATHALLVDATVSVSGLASDLADGDAVNAANVGTMVLGTDGSNYQVVSTDADGHLQIDILSGAGGTQYTEGDTDATITGTASLMEIAGNALAPFQGTVADGLLINLGTNNDVTVTGSVTANAGTNLNTSLLALETGGNLATIATSLGNLDNSVDGNYLNVNLNIAGTDVAANAGVLTAQTLRVTIATDDEVNNLLGTIDVDTGNIVTSVQLIDDTIFVAGTDTFTETASKGQLMLGVRRDADTSLVNTTNEFVPFQVDTNGYLKVEVFSGQALPVTQSGTWDEVGINDSGNSITVDAAAGGLIVGDGTNPVSVNTAGLDDMVNTVNQLVTASVGYVYDTANTNYNRAIESIQSLNITGIGLPAVGIAAKYDDTSPQAITENRFGHLRMSSTGILYVGGEVAHDGVDSGNPIKIGGKAVDMGATPTAVAAADRTDALFTRGGQQFVIGGAPNVLSQNLQITDADGAQIDTAIITAAAGTCIVITCIEVTADNANTVDVSVRIGFGTANTPAADADKVLLFHPGIPAGGGVIKGTGAGIIGVGASNEDLRVTCEDPITGSVSITVTYYTVAIG